MPKSTQAKNLFDFKLEIKQRFKPPRFKHFSKGTKLDNSLLTKIRVGRSNLNQHQFIVGLSDSPECLCHFSNKTPKHYFLDCFLYSPERRILFNLIEHFIPNFQRMNKKQKFDIILRGIDIENPEILSTNITLPRQFKTLLFPPKDFLNISNTCTLSCSQHSCFWVLFILCTLI